MEKLRGKVKQIRAAAAAERLQLDSHSKERAVAMMTRNAVLAYGGDVPIHPSPMGGWTVKGKSAELFQRTLAELILNVNRHANATHATIDIDWRLHRFVVRIEDNGKGLSPDDWASEATSLHRLRNDLSRVGGSLTYKRGRLGGACLEAEIPVEVQ